MVSELLCRVRHLLLFKLPKSAKDKIMIRVNDNFRILPESYLFSTVARKLNEYREAHPGAEVIRMDIGDVTRPLAPAAVEAMTEAVQEMSRRESFRGYGPEQGYSFLRDAIALHDYRQRGIDIKADEIFISDGAKSDLGNLGDIFGPGLRIAIADPSYPAYVDANVIDGRGGQCVDGRWSDIIYLDCLPENDFRPSLPAERPDVIILCYPNNPTGASIDRSELRKWVDYALENGCLIVYDSAYEAYVSSPDAVRSVYEAEGAERCAIEVRSFSKTAGFTGMRCGYTVVPDALKGVFADGSEASLRQLWNRRQCTKFNGASYIVQRGAAALFSEEGRRQVRESVDYYMENARLIRKALSEAGFEVTGGVDSPYVWARIPGKDDSWALFERLLNECSVSCTPGSGFGTLGRGYIRFTGFNTHENTAEAMRRIGALRF